jgi:hypothetical protein
VREQSREENIQRKALSGCAKESERRNMQKLPDPRQLHCACQPELATHERGERKQKSTK